MNEWWRQFWNYEFKYLTHFIEFAWKKGWSSTIVIAVVQLCSDFTHFSCARMTFFVGGSVLPHEMIGKLREGRKTRGLADWPHCFLTYMYNNNNILFLLRLPNARGNCAQQAHSNHFNIYCRKTLMVFFLSWCCVKLKKKCVYCYILLFKNDWPPLAVPPKTLPPFSFLWNNLLKKHLLKSSNFLLNLLLLNSFARSLYTNYIIFFVLQC